MGGKNRGWSRRGWGSRAGRESCWSRFRVLGKPGELHVVFGGGQNGQPLARMLRDRGKRVRMVKRSAGAPEGIELAQGDATDQQFCIETAREASVVYHCMNPPYSAPIWEVVIPKYIENLIAAAGRA